MKNLQLIFLCCLVFTLSLPGIFLNINNILHKKKTNYFRNAFLMSGTLLLYDRAMFFETRKIKVITKDGVEMTFPFDLSIDGYNSYVSRRVYRMSTSEFPCGILMERAFDEIFCKNQIKILKMINIHKISVEFVSTIKPGYKRIFSHECKIY